jgi:hypothetical protein
MVASEHGVAELPSSRVVSVIRALAAGPAEETRMSHAAVLEDGPTREYLDQLAGIITDSGSLESEIEAWRYVSSLSSTSSRRSSAKRFAPSCFAHSASTSPTASRSTGMIERPRGVRTMRLERRSSGSGWRSR